MKRTRPITTLFMLMSVDGKISTGDSDNLDVDRDFPRLKGIKEGLHQYYELERWTDICSLNTGRVFAKIGMNKRGQKFKRLPVHFIIVDNRPHLTKIGVENILKKGKKLYLVTTDKRHPAYRVKNANLEIIFYDKKISFPDLMARLKRDYAVDRLTVQSGGTLNCVFLREKLFDYISIVVAPALIGGDQTSTLIDGPSLSTVAELKRVKSLKLLKARVLQDSYIHLLYAVNNETKIGA